MIVAQCSKIIQKVSFYTIASKASYVYFKIEDDFNFHAKNLK